jgi:hypothetical protein
VLRNTPQPAVRRPGHVRHSKQMDVRGAHKRG